jgi:hypothetical protein
VLCARLRDCPKEKCTLCTITGPRRDKQGDTTFNTRKGDAKDRRCVGLSPEGLPTKTLTVAKGKQQHNNEGGDKQLRSRER